MAHSTTAPTHSAHHPPQHMLAAYTLGDRIPLAHFYVDEAADGRGVVHHSSEDLEHCMQNANRMIQTPWPWRVGGLAREKVAQALSKEGAASVDGAKVVVFGSTDPWVECLCLAAGATSVTTVEYHQLRYDNLQLISTGVSDFNAAVRPGGRLAGSYDVAVALSAFDHDGLGRYGERFHPDGDLLAMQTVWRSLRPDRGRLLLSAPIGPDVVVFNLHRRYGSLRLPRLLAGWHEEARLGWDEARFAQRGDHRRRYESLFVLRRNSTRDLEVDLHDADGFAPRADADAAAGQTKEEL